MKRGLQGGETPPEKRTLLSSILGDIKDMGGGKPRCKAEGGIISNDCELKGARCVIQFFIKEKMVTMIGERHSRQGYLKCQDKEMSVANYIKKSTEKREERKEGETLLILEFCPNIKICGEEDLRQKRKEQWRDLTSSINTHFCETTNLGQISEWIVKSQVSDKLDNHIKKTKISFKCFDNRDLLFGKGYGIYTPEMFITQMSDEHFANFIIKNITSEKVRKNLKELFQKFWDSLPENIRNEEREQERAGKHGKEGKVSKKGDESLIETFNYILESFKKIDTDLKEFTRQKDERESKKLKLELKYKTKLLDEIPELMTLIPDFQIFINLFESLKNSEISNIIILGGSLHITNVTKILMKYRKELHINDFKEAHAMNGRRDCVNIKNFRIY